MDGNFKAEHMRPKNSANEVWLMDGMGFMVTMPEYKDYLAGTLNRVCQDRFSSMILLGGPGVQGTNEEVSPDTSMCYLVWRVKSGSYGQSPGTRGALGVSPGFAE